MSRERTALDSHTTPRAHCALGVRFRAPCALTALVALAAAMLTPGCIHEATFEPVGEDVSLEGHWTVNGATANAATCDANGLATVELVVYDGGTEHRYSALKWDCSAGSFDSSPRGLLTRGEYQVQWRAHDAEAHERFRDSIQILQASDLPVGAHLVLHAVDLRPPPP